ncbi:MAG: prepilin peptidase [Pseudomonadota bacterium]
MLALLSMGYFGSCVGIAAATDLTGYKIYNWTWMALAAGFFPAALFAGMPVTEIGEHALAFISMICLAMLLFYFGAFGAGDGKLIAAIALWTGFAHMLTFLVEASLVGGLFAVLLYLIRRFPRPVFLYRYTWSDALFDRKVGMPYGLPIAVGALLVYPQISWLQAL